MPANLAAMLRSMLKAKQVASSMELRLLEEVARTLPTMNGSAKTARMTRHRSLKCPRCDRRFAMRVHLGRHLSATHGRQKKAA
jgi:hypothetical protein